METAIKQFTFGNSTLKKIIPHVAWCGVTVSSEIKHYILEEEYLRFKGVGLNKVQGINNKQVSRSSQNLQDSESPSHNCYISSKDQLGEKTLRPGKFLS